MVTTPAQAGKTWTRIPNGTKVRLSEGGQNGIIDGLTEFVVGTGRNPDGRTQYRINVGDASRLLIAQDGLLILLAVVCAGRANPGAARRTAEGEGE